MIISEWRKNNIAPGVFIIFLIGTVCPLCAVCKMGNIARSYYNVFMYISIRIFWYYIERILCFGPVVATANGPQPNGAQTMARWFFFFFPIGNFRYPLGGGGGGDYGQLCITIAVCILRRITVLCYHSRTTSCSYSGIDKRGIRALLYPWWQNINFAFSAR